MKSITQEDKELLLKDLCGRLPYEVKGRVYAEVTNGKYDISGDMIFFDAPFDVILDEINFSTEELHVVAVGNEDTIDFIEDQQICGPPFTIDEFKPYLRPLSSMSEEERKELQKITNNNFYASSNYISNSNSPLDGEWRVPYNHFITNAVCNKLISWLDEKHFDHRSDEEGKTLIEKGLAIEVTEKNNPYKE